MMIEVKVCDNCKHKNPVSAVECEKCGYDLMFVYPQKIDDSKQLIEIANSKQDETRNTSLMPENAGDGVWILAYLADEENAVVIKEEVSVGRDCELFNARFNGSNYTSRIHAKLRLFEGNLQIMDASTNGTFIDDKRIPKMEWTDAEDGSVVRFADVSFVVRRR